MQAALEVFGLGRTTNELTHFINAADKFASALDSTIYPVLEPTQHFGIYQSWE
jgi:hypothetical protein